MNILAVNAKHNSMGKKFIIYGILGICAEIFWTGLGSLIHGDLGLRGVTYIWMFPIYGLAVFMEPVHNRIRGWPLILRGGVYILVIFTVEYSCGFILKHILGVCPWDYGKGLFSINGFIRLDFAPVWFCLGLLFEIVHDTLDRFVSLIKVNS